MKKLKGWNQDTPDTQRLVLALRVFNDGSKGPWRCSWDGWGWATYDGIYISGVLGWKELEE